MEAPVITWAHDGSAEFCGHWQVRSEAPEVTGASRVCYWIEEMPDWARKAMNALGIESVRWGPQGASAVKCDVAAILGQAVDLGLIHGFLEGNREHWEVA